MLPFEDYQDKPQTYVKHFFLENYLERLAYNIFNSKRPSIDFAYIDGFSGPWRSDAENYNDTSFAIALKTLKKIKRQSFRPGASKSLRCLFVESNPKSFADLKGFLSTVKGADCEPINDEFETAVDKIAGFVGNAFSFCFIDPTGFKDLPMNSLKPILDLPGEFLINFMYTFINKHLTNEDDDTRGQMDDLFGGGNWREKIAEKRNEGLEREDAIIETYCERLKQVGKVKYVTSTRVLFGTADRTYFYLVYGTNHQKGLVEFRKVESRTVEEQEKVRNILKYEQRAKRVGTDDLFAPLAAPISARQRSFDELRGRNLDKMEQKIRNLVRLGPCVYEKCLDALELPYVWEADIKEILKVMQQSDVIELRHKNPRGRVATYGTVIVPK